VAQTIGTLSLSLRSLADNQTELERAIAAGDVNIPDNATPEEEERLLRQAMARPDDGKSTYVTGGDVSRFQRRTAPPQGVVGGAPAAAAPAAAPAGTAAPVRQGPSVRVTRGKETEEVSVARSAAFK
ncbi:MAG: Flp pilus assembly protein CpaB, partial [Erythrobacter sp.]